MNIYSIYTDTSKKNRSPILIRQGFSFIASFFNFLWALYHKMWIIVFFVAFASFAANSSGSIYVVYSINIAILFLFGAFSSEMREIYATKSHYKLSDIVLADNDEEAEVRYYMRINNERHI